MLDSFEACPIARQSRAFSAVPPYFAQAPGRLKVEDYTWPKSSDKDGCGRLDWHVFAHPRGVRESIGRQSAGQSTSNKKAVNMAIEATAFRAIALDFRAILAVCKTMAAAFVVSDDFGGCVCVLRSVQGGSWTCTGGFGQSRASSAKFGEKRPSTSRFRPVFGRTQPAFGRSWLQRLQRPCTLSRFRGLSWPHWLRRLHALPPYVLMWCCVYACALARISNGTVMNT